MRYGQALTGLLMLDRVVEVSFTSRGVVRSTISDARLQGSREHHEYKALDLMLFPRCVLEPASAKEAILAILAIGRSNGSANKARVPPPMPTRAA